MKHRSAITLAVLSLMAVSAGSAFAGEDRAENQAEARQDLRDQQQQNRKDLSQKIQEEKKNDPNFSHEDAVAAKRAQDERMQDKRQDLKEKQKEARHKDHQEAKDKN